MKLSTSIFKLGVFAPVVYAASLQQVTDFGDNPGNNVMFLYAPDQVAENPAVIVALHPCGGSAEAYFSQVPDLPPAADAGGFILIYPGSTEDFNCWDVATTESLTHDGGSDSLSVVNMVNYVIEQYGADASRVFATGSSSGAMMSQLLAGAYPDVFAGISAYSGVPYGCLAGSPGSSPQTADPACASGQIIKTGEEWADLVYSGYPGYNGSRPAVQIWHGTADNVVYPQNYDEAVKQWSTVFGVEMTAQNPDTPLPGYTQSVFGDGTQFEAYLADGVGHVVPTQVQPMLSWFGLV
ncbi:alpha/beta hydrolase family esterase [Aspergillus lucknowensis]|uniref:Carboxylic ester hydrolase n=1 Tax=Aspergillus lucknowensis TaxID=176173 RepID=A0ABR4M4W5_9EURO